MAAAGASHSLLLLANGEVLSMGYGHMGQLGNGLSGYTSRQYKPDLVSNLYGKAFQIVLIRCLVVRCDVPMTVHSRRFQR